MKNIKIDYTWTPADNCSLSQDSEDFIVVEPPYDFGDFLSDRGVNFDHDETTNTFYVLDESGERTGETFSIVSETETDEEL